MGRHAEGSALAAAARNTLLPVTLATVEPPPRPSSVSPDDGSNHDPEEAMEDGGEGTAAAAAAAAVAAAAGMSAQPRVELIKSDPSGRAFRLVIPPKTKTGSAKDLLLYLREPPRKTFNVYGGTGGGGWGSAPLATAAAAPTDAAGGISGSLAALQRLRDALVGPGIYCSPRHRMPFNPRNEGSKCVWMTW